jgi:DNA polymerase-3 subunit gamma/tau
MLGTIDHQHVSRLLRLLAEGDPAGLMAAVDGIDEQFPDYARMLEDLARYLQRIAVYQVIGAADTDDEFDETEIAELAGQIAAEDVQLFYQTAILGRRDIHLAPDPRSGAEMTLLRMLAFQPGDASIAAGKGPKRAAANASAAAIELKPAVRSQTAKTSQSGSEKDDVQWQDPDWAALIPLLGVSGANRLLASNCAYLRRDGNTVFLGLDQRSESLLTRPRQTALAEALTKYFGEPLNLDISVQQSKGEKEAATPIQEENQREDERLQDARMSLESDPNVRVLRDMFGAEINADSVEIVDQQSTPKPE